MINASKYTRQAFYTALNGIVSVNVYKEDVPVSENTHHIVLRMESETDRTNNHHFVTNQVVVVECCGVFHNSADPDVVEDMDEEVKQAIKNIPSSTLPGTADLQIVSVRPESSTYLTEDDGTKRYYRKITRWSARVAQLTT